MRKYLFVFLSFFMICGTAMADLCNAGTYTVNTGTVQCIPCPKGTYNANAGATFCTSCSSGFTTRLEGSKSASDCIHYVDKFYLNNSSSSFSWPSSIDPDTKVDTTYLSFPSS